MLSNTKKIIKDTTVNRKRAKAITTAITIRSAPRRRRAKLKSTDGVNSATNIQITCSYKEIQTVSET